jgi:hypothetical protein
VGGRLVTVGLGAVKLAKGRGNDVGAIKEARVVLRWCGSFASFDPALEFNGE